MKHKRNFITDFFLLNMDRNFFRHAEDWTVVDLDKVNNKKAKWHYGKKLKDLLGYKEKIKRPLFIQIGVSGHAYYLPVTLFNPKTMQSITTLAAADSGASCSVFGHELAEAIGIDWKKGKKSKAFAGEKCAALYAYRVKMLISVSKSKDFFEEEVDIIHEKHSASLLGLSGFFNHYEVVFNPKFGIKYKFIN